jgi:DNA-binding transcriptional ArsR family regulator
MNVASSRAAQEVNPLETAAALFRGLADPTRLAIVQRLARGEARVVDLVAQLKLAQSTVSGHLSCLRECGLVDFRPVGRQSLYFLARPELRELLFAAESLLKATGQRVALCRNYGRKVRS